MTESLSVSVKSISDGKIYIDGTACGDTGKYYCITYATTGAGGNIINSSQTYTFWLGGCLNLGNIGCYIPYNGDGTYRIYLDEVTNYGCENKIRWVDADTIIVEPAVCPYPNIASIEFSDSTPYTGESVSFWRDGEYGGSGHYIVSRRWDFGDGGSATTSSATHTYTSPGTFTVSLTVTNDCGKSYTRQKTISVSAETVLIDVAVVDQHATGVAGAHVYIPTAKGAKTISTNYMGVAVGFTLDKGANHTASITYLPSAWETTHQSTLTFNANQPGRVTLYVNKIEVYVCTDGQERYPETCSDGSTIHKEVCESNAWNPSGETCPVNGMYSITCYVKNELGVGIKDVYVNCFVKSGYTGYNGYIKFSDLEKGNYTVEIIPPDGYECIDGCAESFTLDSDKTINFTITGEPALCDEGEKKCVWDPSQSRAEIKKCVSGTWVNDSWCPVGATCNNGICGAAPPPPPPPTCSEKNKTECDASPDCYWWDSDNFCHDTPEQTDYPTLTITSDIDIVGGLDAYVDGVKVGLTPITKSFTETDIGKDVSVAGVLADIIGTKGKNVTLSAGSNMVNIEFLMDNKEILAGGTIAGVLLLKYI